MTRTCGLGGGDESAVKMLRSAPVYLLSPVVAFPSHLRWQRGSSDADAFASRFWTCNTVKLRGVSKADRY